MYKPTEILCRREDCLPFSHILLTPGQPVLVLLDEL